MSKLSLRAARRASALAVGLVVLVSSVAAADVLQQDVNFSVPGADDEIVDLGRIVRGSTRQRQVSFQLRCRSGELAHVEEGQRIRISYYSAALDKGSWKPSLASATSASIGPVPASWPDDGHACPSGGFVLGDDGNSVVTFAVPNQLGRHRLRVKFQSTLTPAGGDDAGDIIKGSRFSIRFDFVVVPR